MQDNVTENKKVLDLITADERYDLIIPKNVEQKIRILCREINTIEWSGVLFYTIEGTIEGNDLKIKCKDILLMDVGSSATTEYTVNADISSYMVDNPELLNPEVYRGLIHSHHSMATFFSGTDVNTLKSEGADTNHFVSLIVNNEGKYTAAFTRKLKVSQSIKEKYSYNTWGNTEVKGSRNFTIDDVYLERFNLNIIKESVAEDNSELYNRIKELRAAKSYKYTTPNIPNATKYSSKETPQFNYDWYSQEYNKTGQGYSKYSPEYPKVKSSVPGYTPSSSIDTTYKGTPNKVETKAYKEKSLWEEDELPYNVTKLNDEVIDTLVSQILTCSILINYQSLDLDKWLKNMDKLFTTKFKTTKQFKTFMEFYLDYLLIDHPINIEVSTEVDETSILATAISNKLQTYPRNKWIDCIIDTLNLYVI